MWTCSLCDRTFRQQNQHHYCGDRTIGHFLNGRSEKALALFDQLIEKISDIGPVKLHATKSMLVISADVGFAYVIQMGKEFIDVVLPFETPYEDNLCFRKIGKVPGSNDFNHHLRIMSADDFNAEVCSYLAKAYANGKAV
ncbi:MAG: DUF5655 domain-containing protein [Pedobacter sp.]|nr:DUF5655 domain-containing protein [Pedobacter sp.]MDQ8053154.1 DUF5655 domain-containing protein [Pedobacter sp.]